MILILKGDIITEIDGKKIKDDVDLRSYLYENKKPGESVTVTVIRDGKTKEVKVKLKQQKDNQNVKADQNANHLAKAIEISLDNL